MIQQSEEGYSWKVNYLATMPLHEQLKNRIQAHIKSGQLRTGNLLPGTRVLSRTLSISNATSKMAYKLLEEEGSIVHVKGQGYVVSAPSEPN